jgi:uncharacterized protein
MTFRRTGHVPGGRVRAAAVVFLLLLLVCAGAHGQSGKFPRPVGHVNDFAGFISSDTERLLNGIALEVKAKTGAEMAIVTIRTTGGEDVQEYAVDLFMDWNVGQKGEDNGLLLLIAVDDRQMWIKPGYGLEGAIPDAFAHGIYYDVLRPAFRSGRQDEGLVEATRMLAERILAEEGQTLAYDDTLAARMVARPGERAQVTKRRAFSMLLSALFPMLVFILIIISAARRGVRRGSGFWIGTGGRGGGSFGGFGGGFGGFGGGSAGGAGAGGGW